MLKQVYLDELTKIVKESHKVNLVDELTIPQKDYVILRFEPLAKYGMLDPDITAEEYDEILTKAEEIIDFLASE